MNAIEKSLSYTICHCCDLLVYLPELSEGCKSYCPRCHSTLQVRAIYGKYRAQLYAISSLFMLILANFFPFIQVSLIGLTNQINLLEIPKMLFSDDYLSIGVIFIFFVQILPAISIVFIFLLHSSIKLSTSIKIIMARLIFLSRRWGMADIFLIGVLVSFIKLMSYGHLEMGSSFICYCFFCFFYIKTITIVDRRFIWDSISSAPTYCFNIKSGKTALAQGLRACSCCYAVLLAETRSCPRCYTRGYARKRHSLQYTLALLATALMLYIPANLLPVMTTQAIGNIFNSTIISGVFLLWNSGSYPIAIIIFIASIVIPFLKIFSLAWLCWGVHYNSRIGHANMHFIYELTELVGRWSMVDVFVITVLSSLVNMANVMRIYPENGAVVFAAVVILTILASIAFDSRLIWDRQLQINQERIK